MRDTMRHVYVKAPLEVVREAWEGFVRDNMGINADPTANFYLIPAQGGCFLVAVQQAKPERRLLRRKESPEAILERRVSFFAENFGRWCPDGAYG